MFQVAREELGMTIDDFYSCTWYDWGGWVARINEQQRKRIEDKELLMEMFRSSLSYYYNWNSPTNKLNPQDFWKLSYDKQVPEEEVKEVNETVKRLERIAKERKRRG